jgi:hypothetical protein
MLLTACDLQPPKQRAAGSGSTATADARVSNAGSNDTATMAATPLPTPDQPPADAGVVSADASVARVEPTQECLDVAVHVANIQIAEADASLRASLEQDRTQLVRRIATACAATWDEEVRACLLKGEKRKDHEPCAALLRQKNRDRSSQPPPPRPPRPEDAQDGHEGHAH